MRNRIGLWAVCLMLGSVLSVAKAGEADIAATTRADTILERVREANQLCEGVSLTDKVTVVSGKIVERPVVLCAYKESDRTWHTIDVRLGYPVPPSYVICVAGAPSVSARSDCVLPFRVASVGYRVEHLAGYGATRLIFNVFASGEKLTVYSTRHIWFTKSVTTNDPSVVLASAETLNYTPFHSDLRDEELLRRGRLFLRSEVNAAFDRLRSKHVYSRAFPERLVSDVIARETLEALGVIEQSDDKKFHEDERGTIESVYLEYALNGSGSYKWAQSSAMALGAYQFTDGGGNGTYSEVVRRYGEARLDPNFENGARDLGNVLEAAACLLDLEVSQFQAILPVFARDPILGGIYPVAAYNGGHGAAAKLYEWIKTKKIDIEEKDIPLPHAFVSERVTCPCTVQKFRGRNGKVFTRKTTHIVKKVNTETPGYVDKYISVINYLHDVKVD